jgi:acid phosphatase (class A)
LIALTFGVSSLSTTAEHNHCLDEHEARPVYFNDPSQVALVRVLAPPPSPGSLAAEKDVQRVLKAQQKLTGARIDEARADACISVFRFTDVMGPAFTFDNLPFARGFFERGVL